MIKKLMIKKLTKLKTLGRFIGKGWGESTTITIENRYYYNGKRVRELPPHVKKEMEETFGKADEALEGVGGILK